MKTPKISIAVLGNPVVDFEFEASDKLTIDSATNITASVFDEKLWGIMKGVLEGFPSPLNGHYLKINKKMFGSFALVLAQAVSLPSALCEIKVENTPPASKQKKEPLTSFP